MNADRFTARLSEWLDGDLAPLERAELEAHLGDCAECTRTLEELRAVRDRAAALPPIAPLADLWPGILARIEAERATAPPPPAGAGRVLALPRRAPRTWSFTLPRLALAASLLVVLSGGGVWFALMSRAPLVAQRAGAPDSGVTRPVNELLAATPTRSEARREASRTATPGGETMAAGFDVARYEATIDELEQVLDAHRAELDTSTVRVIEQNLDVIDGAVGEARRALAADPASRYLNFHLASQLRRKAQLLKQATALVTAPS